MSVLGGLFGLGLVSLACKEGLQQGFGLTGRDAIIHVGRVMAGGLAKEMRAVDHGTHFGISGTKIDPPNARMANGGCTHGARFKRHIKISASEPFLAKCLGCFADHQHFSVCGWIKKLPRTVAIGGYDLAIHHQHRTHGHLIAASSLARLIERDVHVSRRGVGGVCHLQGLPYHGAHRQRITMANQDQSDDKPKGERIAKVIARSGLCSRRDAERWIADGRVKLNGKLLTTPAVTVTGKDKIEVDGAPLPEAERTRLWLYHKDKGVITAARDPEGRKVLRDVLPKELKTVHPVGRLDFNTEGLLLLTNDGGLKRLLELPSTGWLRRYRVRAFGEAPEPLLNKARKGMEIEGVQYGPMEIVVERQKGDNQWLTVGLREGKNREVKVVLGALGLQVNRLIRISYGPFQLGELEAGAVQEIRSRVLRDQLSGKIFKDAGIDFDGPMRTAIVGRDTPARPDKPAKTGRGGSGNAPLRKGRTGASPNGAKRGKPGFVSRPGAARKAGAKRSPGGRGPQKTRGR